MGTRLTLAIDNYHCEPCTRKQGTLVAELVRMIPRAIVFNGEVIGEEYWCCPVCFDKKFPVKRPRAKTEKAKPPRRKNESAAEPTTESVGGGV